MSNTFIKIFFFIVSLNCLAQKNNLTQAMVSSFEDRICEYYSIEKENSHHAFLKYIKELASENENLNAITSTEELELLEISKIELADYIWITNKVKRGKSNKEETLIIDYNNMDSNTRKYFEKLKKTDKLLTVNYFEDYSKDLIIKSKNKDLEELILTFRDVTDSTPSLIASALINTPIEKFKNKYLKTFIAFELYYTTLNNLIKNE